MRDRLLLAARVLTAGVFLYAAISKVPDMAAFAVDVANYRILPSALVPAAASALVGIEIVAGMALLLGLWSRGAALVAAGLLALFVGGLAQALLRGIDLACGCFGTAERATWLTVLRDLAFLVPALAVAWYGGGSWRPPRDRGAAPERGAGRLGPAQPGDS